MSEPIHPLLKRSFAVAAILLTAAAVLCLIVLLRYLPGDEGGLGESFRYDLVALKKVDPSLIVADEVDGFLAGVQHPSVMVSGPSNTLYVGGAGEMAILDLEGIRRSLLKVSGLVTALAVESGGGRIFAAFRDRFEIIGPSGDTVGGWQGLNSNSVFTSIVLLENAVFVADAGNRLVLKYAMDGALISKFGDKASDYSEGFVIPSPYFPLAVAPDDTLWVVDTGRHRFVNVTKDGRVRSMWEKSAMTVDGFCGCCNPTHFAVRDDGSFVTAEKGIVRVKVHSADGSLAGVVAAPEKFGADTRGLSIVVDERGRVLVLDPERGRVRIFRMRNTDRGTAEGGT